MRKFILVAAMVLASATAQAGQTRSLTLAANDQPVATEPAKAVEAPKEALKDATKEVPKEATKDVPQEAPKFTERPAVIDTSVPPAKADEDKPGADKNPPMQKADKSKRRHRSIEARVIYELHRHGIYW